ncbi:PREDICTED: uncharacterized protein LOC108371201 [Rhagoletis zephyria]|uniref:uncharacterized protein LOC108371201 n=1 Tax=Rhagoletis zephyria TaxID=28612 RepID=UPI00081184A0|nr:PREDICTED: uncharacterized protein LOC108371201 [Rhagoletis zephyria]XP_036329309.1 uncharacterized protein LOC118741442 [Rhagoletis pomonella]
MDSQPPPPQPTAMPTPAEAQPAPSNPNTSIGAAAASVNYVTTTATSSVAAQTATSTNSVPTSVANVVTIPVPIVQNEENYTYVTVKGSLHDRSCAVFGLNDTEIQALSKRFGNGLKGAVNGVMVTITPMDMVNTLAQLGYKVVCSCGEAEISWTMQREI